MPSIAVVTDSVATVPGNLRAELGIGVVPLGVEVDGVVYLDGVDLAPADLYRRMVLTKAVPKTSQPSIGAYLVKFEEVAAAGASRILCLTLGASFSGTHDTAVQAARIFAEDAPPGSRRPEVRVIDTRLAATAEGWVVIEAARCARTGASLGEVLRRVEWVSSHARLLAVIDTLEYLMRSGRVPKLAGLAASALGVRPMAQLRRGEAVAAGLAPSLDRALLAMVRRMARQSWWFRFTTSRTPRLHVGVMHAGALDRGELLVSLIRERLAPAEIFLADFTPVMGVHTGPGVTGVGYFID